MFDTISGNARRDLGTYRPMIAFASIAGHGVLLTVLVLLPVLYVTDALPPMPTMMAFVAAAPTDPPATKTRPSASTVAECPLRGMLIGGAGINVPVVSKNSASVDGPAPLSPPVMNIRPSCNNVDAALLRGESIDPAESQFPMEGCGIFPLTKIPAARIKTASRAGLRVRRIDYSLAI